MMYLGHLDLTHSLWFTRDDLLSSGECASFIAQIEGGEREIAPIHGLDGSPAIDIAVRNNTRLMFTDHTLARDLLGRLRPALPSAMRGRSLVGVNEFFRLYRYCEGERHGCHWDTPIELPDGRVSELTLVMYLNNDFAGGRTVFNELDVAVEPEPGRALLFQQRVLHEAEPVTSGTKYVLRSEIFYHVEPGR